MRGTSQVDLTIHADQPTFREVQPMWRVGWVTLLVCAIALLTWYSFVQQIVLGRPFGTNPGPDWLVWLFWLLFGLGFPVLFFDIKLIVEVQEDQVYVRYVPFLQRRIPLADVKRYEARTYRPIAEYSGWGIKGWSRQRISYSVSGNRGVELELRNGQRVMIGSQRADELAAAIAAAIAARLG